MRWILDEHLYPSPGPGLPSLAELNFDEIRSPQVLAALRAIEQKGLHETAHRTLTYACQIFNFGDACGFLSGKNPTASLRRVLAPVSVKHHASIYSPDGLEVHGGDTVRLLMRDCGVGVDPGRIERLFESFDRTKRRAGYRAGHLPFDHGARTDVGDAQRWTGRDVRFLHPLRVRNSTRRALTPRQHR